MEFPKKAFYNQEVTPVTVDPTVISISVLKAILSDEREAIDEQIEHVQNTIPDHLTPISEQLAHSKEAAQVEGRSLELSIITGKVLRAIEDR